MVLETENVSMINGDNNKIDMVYLWVDGNDPAFIERKNDFLSGEINRVNKATGDVRFWDNEELRYSLRSLEKYAPWINHVYIITDRQVPKWLNTDYEKVTVVDHSQIMPKECIPCFNSNVIEYFLPYVPNLSEVFLYGNDDTFFCALVNKEDFVKDGKVINRLIPMSKLTVLKKRMQRFMVKCGLKKDKGSSSPVFRATDLLEEYYGAVDYYVTHHNIDVYSKSAYLETLTKFEAEFEATNKHRFRNKNCIHRIIFALDAVYSGKAIIRTVPAFAGISKIFVRFNKKEIFSYFGKEYHLDRVKHVMKQNKPKLFCLNASDKTDRKIKEAARKFMEELFPEPSKFEKFI